MDFPTLYIGQVESVGRFFMFIPFVIEILKAKHEYHFQIPHPAASGLALNGLAMSILNIGCRADTGLHTLDSSPASRFGDI